MERVDLVDKIMEIVDEAIGWLDDIDVETDIYAAVEDVERASELLHKAYSLLEKLRETMKLG